MDTRPAVNAINERTGTNMPSALAQIVQSVSEELRDGVRQVVRDNGGRTKTRTIEDEYLGITEQYEYPEVTSPVPKGKVAELRDAMIEQAKGQVSGATAEQAKAALDFVKVKASQRDASSWKIFLLNREAKLLVEHPIAHFSNVQTSDSEETGSGSEETGPPSYQLLSTNSVGPGRGKLTISTLGVDTGPLYDAWEKGEGGTLGVTAIQRETNIATVTLQSAEGAIVTRGDEADLYLGGEVPDKVRAAVRDRPLRIIVVPLTDSEDQDDGDSEELNAAGATGIAAMVFGGAFLLTDQLNSES